MFGDAPLYLIRNNELSALDGRCTRCDISLIDHWLSRRQRSNTSPSPPTCSPPPSNPPPLAGTVNRRAISNRQIDRPCTKTSKISFLQKNCSIQEFMKRGFLWFYFRKMQWEFQKMFMMPRGSLLCCNCPWLYIFWILFCCNREF